MVSYVYTWVDLLIYCCPAELSYMAVIYQGLICVHVVDVGVALGYYR
jgi:hypothetical protein